MNIEVEVACILTKEQYDELMEFFHNEAEFKGEEEQITYYYEAPVDIRIQKSSTYSKIWMKKGVIHDEAREEVEVKTDPENFDNLAKIFEALNYKIAIKWFRKRNDFKWNDMDVSVDDTKGYAMILELEKMASEETKDETLTYLKTKLKELNLESTPKEEFDKKYKNYKENWETLTQN